MVLCVKQEMTKYDCSLAFIVSQVYPALNITWPAEDCWPCLHILFFSFAFQNPQLKPETDSDNQTCPKIVGVNRERPVTLFERRAAEPIKCRGLQKRRRRALGGLLGNSYSRVKRTPTLGFLLMISNQELCAWKRA